MGCCESTPVETAPTSAAQKRGPDSAEELSEMEKEKIRDAFNIYDNNRDGTIQRSELENVLEVFLGKKPTPHQLDKIFKKVDANNNGTIDFEEFEAMMSERKKTTSRYVDLFQQYDKNGDGFISKDELLETLNSQASNFSEEEVEEIINAADLDRDGLIDYKEFVTYFV